MPSIHVIKWLENLKNSNHELYWFDILDRGKLDTFKEVIQITNWKKPKTEPINENYFWVKKWQQIYKRFLPFTETSANEKLQQLILEIQPDTIHSFEMQSCSYPILKTMDTFSNLKWIYSCWGSDLFFYQKIPSQKMRIKKVLKRIDVLHTDCLRDYELAKQFGFKGKFGGVIPGGGGFDLEYLKQFQLPISERKIILVKGYQHQFGRAIHVCKALETILPDLKKFEVHFFGCHQIVIDYILENNLPFQYYSRSALKPLEILQLMGKSKIYIGNSISDGIPNTLLEAIVMGVFPIQSNPGSATIEIIENGKNGLLIQNPDSIEEIQKHISYTINQPDIFENANKWNSNIALHRLSHLRIQKSINQLYKL